MKFVIVLFQERYAYSKKNFPFFQVLVWFKKSQLFLRNTPRDQLPPGRMNQFPPENHVQYDCSNKNMMDISFLRTATGQRQKCHIFSLRYEGRGGNGTHLKPKEWSISFVFLCFFVSSSASGTHFADGSVKWLAVPHLAGTVSHA